MQSIKYIPGSNQALNASVATVQTIRSAGATSNTVNTVSGFPTFFYATMGTPHTFTDPVTGETITIISDATAVDFAGTINAGKIDIVAIAPGYTDLGSKVGDIIIVRPVTEWANNIFNILSQAHDDNGDLKITQLDRFFKNSEILFDFVVPGGAVLAGLGYGSTLTASLSAGVCYINGLRQTIAAVATRTYTASKDTYVDALYNASGVATIVYTEVANNAASPALAANSVRLGIVVSGANIAAAASINQGQLDRLLPIASSQPYQFTDSLGNIIYPTDPQRLTLGMRQITSNQTMSTSLGDIPGLTAVPFIVPYNNCRIEGKFRGAGGTSVDNSWFASGILEGATILATSNTGKVAASGTSIALREDTVQPLTAGLHTWKPQAGNGGSTLYASASQPLYLKVSRA